VCAGERDATLFVLATCNEPRFSRGDGNTDGAVDIGDAVCILSYLFGSPENECKALVAGCLDASDANDDGAIDLGDGIYLLQNLFAGGPDIPEPGSACGIDPTTDTLDCAGYAPCRE
jgi:hypothetical protein